MRLLNLSRSAVRKKRGQAKRAHTHAESFQILSASHQEIGGFDRVLIAVFFVHNFLVFLTHFFPDNRKLNIEDLIF